MERTFKVVWFIDNIFQVLNIEDESVEYQGSLADCEAFIRLKEGGYF